jgi:hypothetical protein
MASGICGTGSQNMRNGFTRICGTGSQLFGQVPGFRSRKANKVHLAVSNNDPYFVLAQKTKKPEAINIALRLRV